MAETRKLVDRTLLDTFWALSEGQDQKRIDATQKLISLLRSGAGDAHPEKTPSDPLKYTLERLIRGLASGRKWARLGFVLALTQVLRNFSDVTTDQVCEIAKKVLATSAQDNKKEQSDVYLGRVMLYSALVHSERVKQMTGEQLESVIAGLTDCSSKKPPLALLCTEVMGQIIAQVDGEQFTRDVLPTLDKQFSSGWDDCGPETLFLLLRANQHHREKIKKKYLTKHWGGKKLLTRENLANIGGVLGSSTEWHPLVHPVCAEVFEHAASDQDLLIDMWNTAVIGHLLTQSPQKKYLCFHLVSKVLRLTTTASGVASILSEELVQILTKSLSNKSSVLHGAAKHLVEELQSFIKDCTDPSLEVAIVKCLLSGPAGLQFDINTHSHTLENMMQNLTADGGKEVSTFLQNIWTGKGGETDDDQTSTKSQRKSAVHLQCALVTQHYTTAGPAAVSELLQPLLMHGYFDVQGSDESVSQSSGTEAVDVSQQIQGQLQDSLFQCLNRLATFNPGVPAKVHYTQFVDVLYSLVDFTQGLYSKPEVAVPVSELDDKSKEAWNKMMKSVKQLRGKTGSAESAEKEKLKGKVDATAKLAFQLLFLYLGLQMLKAPKSVLESLQDLHICCEKVLKKNRRSSVKALDTDELEWVEVVTELLLSLLSQPSNLTRNIANTAFTLLCPHLTPGALHLLLEAMAGGSEDGPLDFEDDEGMDMDDADADDKREMETEDQEESSSEEEEDAEEDGTIDDSFRAAVKAALGDAADKSDDEQSEPDMDDEAMFRLDGVLAAAFKSMRKDKHDNKEREQQVKHFKNRVLGLLEILVKSDAPLNVLLALIGPILEMMDSGLKNKKTRDLAERAMGVFHTLLKTKKLTFDTSSEQESLPEMVKDLIQQSKRVSGVPLVKEVAAAVLLMVRLVMGLDSSTNPSPVKTRAMTKHKTEQAGQGKKDILSDVVDVIGKGLEDYCERRDPQLNHILFHTILERQPALFWQLSDMLLKYAVNQDTKIYCRTQLCSMLAAMLRKNIAQLIGEDSWSVFSSKVQGELGKVILHVPLDKLKQRYIQEVLLVLHKCLSVTCTDRKVELGDDFKTKLQDLKKHGNKDVKTLCNKLTNMLNQGSGGKSKKQKKKRQVSESQTEAEVSESSPEKKVKKETGSNVNGDVEETLSVEETTPSKKKKKKKKKDQD